MANDYVQINYDVSPPLELSSDYSVCKIATQRTLEMVSNIKLFINHATWSILCHTPSYISLTERTLAPYFSSPSATLLVSLAEPLCSSCCFTAHREHCQLFGSLTGCLPPCCCSVHRRCLNWFLFGDSLPFPVPFSVIVPLSWCCWFTPLARGQFKTLDELLCCLRFAGQKAQSQARVC